MYLQYNVCAWNADRNYGMATRKLSSSTEKLASGYKINRAADDTAGLNISEGMRCMIRGMGRASKNAQDGLSLLQTADGALSEVDSVLHRIRELSVQAGNDTNTQEDRSVIQSEVDALLTEIDRIADSTEFNKKPLLDGSLAGDPNAFVATKNMAAGQAVDLEGLKSVNGVVLKDPVRSSSATSVCTSPQLASVESALQDIVPDAVGSIMNTFSSAFGGNASSISNQIGINLYAENSSTLAYVACQYSYDSAGKISGMSLNLSVNVAALRFSGDNLTTNATAATGSYESLQATIAHEMMHAFMDDVLPNGMLGATDGVIDHDNQFPGWFKEGMAQTAAGGCSNYNDWVNGSLGLTATSTPEAISNALKSGGNKLSSGTTASKYGTGYLAAMYMGYMANGTGAVTSSAIGSGLDSVLSRVANGETLGDVIKSISNGKYNTLVDFQNKFGDSESAQFVNQLLVAAGSTGSGSVLANLSDKDVLDGNKNNSYYAIDVNSPDTYKQSSGTHTFKDGGSGGYVGLGSNLMLQVSSITGQGIGICLDDTHAVALGLGDLSMMSFEEVGHSLDSINYAVEKVNDNRSRIGAYMKRLEYTISNLDNSTENIQSAESDLRDADMADEMVVYSTQNILTQAGQSMIAQANQNQQGILELLQ